jgi:hypothetical protein
MEIKKKKSSHFLNEELRIKKMRKLRVVVVEPKKQSKWPAFLCNKNKKNRNLGYPIEERVRKKRKKTILGCGKKLWRYKWLRGSV